MGLTWLLLIGDADLAIRCKDGVQRSWCRFWVLQFGLRGLGFGV